EALVEAHDRLRREPRDRAAKVDFVTIYHMVIEGTLGITASHFTLEFLRDRDLLPGFVEGYGRIHSDEQRHIAYGTQFLPAAAPGVEQPCRHHAADRPEQVPLPRDAVARRQAEQQRRAVQRDDEDAERQMHDVAREQPTRDQVRREAEDEAARADVVGTA